VLHVERQHRSLLAGLSVTFLTFGGALTLVDALLPGILREFDWSYSQAGWVLWGGSAGYFAATFVGGLLVDRLGSRTVLLGGMLCQALALMLFGQTDHWTANLAVKVLAGGGGGALEVACNCALVRIDRPGTSRAMNFAHAGFSAGAAGGPVLVGAVLAAGVPWRWLLRGAGLGCAVVAVGVAMLPFDRVAAPGRGDLAGATPARARSAGPIVLLAMAVMLLYVGVEVGVSHWIAEFFVRLHGLAESRAALSVGLFWGGLLAGRLGLSLLYGGTGQARLLVILSLATAAALAVVVFSPSPGGANVAVVLAGLGCSAVYTCVQTIVARQVPHRQGAAMGLVSTAGGVGAMGIPVAMAATADLAGLLAGFAIYPALAAVMAGLAGVMWLRLRRREATDHPGE
jgi:fucose permease